jgi:hypothetical protein
MRWVQRKMGAQPQRLSEAEILESARLCEGKQASISTRRAGEAEPENRLQCLAIVLERLWLFYQAMRSGKPLTNADEMLAEVGTALRTATKTRK